MSYGFEIKHFDIYSIFIACQHCYTVQSTSYLISQEKYHWISSTEWSFCPTTWPPSLTQSAGHMHGRHRLQKVMRIDLIGR